MKTKSKVQNIVCFFLTLLAYTLLITSETLAAPLQSPFLGINEQSVPLNPFRPPPDPAKSIKIEWPETYIEPLARYGLDLALPAPIRRGLSLDAGYDRWAGLPTATIDYFLPVKAWKQESIFFMPRMTLDGKTEAFSMGAGVRRLLGGRAMVGAYAFHDWSRPRGSDTGFLKEAGIGAEVSLLPGRFADLSVSANAYLPVNERRTFSDASEMMITERFPRGWDARLNFLFPALIDFMDARFTAEAHAYRGQVTEIGGYKLALSLGTRDGMLGAVVEQANEQSVRNNTRVMGTVKLAFDWADLLEGKNPFSAPHRASSVRRSRDLREGLYSRVARKHDLAADRKVTNTALTALVHDDRVIFNGGFPSLPNAPVTVQVASSPWRDAMEIVTDSEGRYAGQLRLPAGRYKLRLLHKETGHTSRAQEITIREDE